MRENELSPTCMTIIDILIPTAYFDWTPTARLSMSILTDKMVDRGYHGSNYYQETKLLRELGLIGRSRKGGMSDPFHYYYCGEL
jgi:hypothetical protein